MKFGEIPIGEAEGALLAHSVHLTGKTFRKGRLLTPDDLALLQTEGVTHVTVARLEQGELGENDTAARLAAALASPGLIPSPAATGRVHLKAVSAGVLVQDITRIGALNSIDEALTLATAPAFEMLEKGQIAATVKVITFGVPESSVATFVELARVEPPMLSLRPLRKKRIGFLQTTLPGWPARVLDKARSTMASRLAELGCRISHELCHPHTLEGMSTGLQSLADADCDIILVIGASAVVDRRDILPRAVATAGGDVIRLGIPVDPGHLTLFARLGKTTILGLPGSARSPRLHGFDLILRRLVADIDVSGDALAGMGVGGVLKESAGVLRPREILSRSRVGGIVLAAGQSRRMGSVNKMLVSVDGEPMIRHVVRAMTRSQACPVIVVTGHENDKVGEALQSEEVRLVYNPDHASGMSTSLRAGLAALPPSVDAAVIALGDMPRVTEKDIDALIDAHDSNVGGRICVPTHGGKRGNPVLWDRQFFPALQNLSGDVGARHLIEEHPDHLVEVPCETSGVLLDFDTPEALRANQQVSPDRTP